MCEVFLGEETKKKCEYSFCENNFRKASIIASILNLKRILAARNFKFLVIKKRVKQSFLRLQKAKEKKPMKVATGWKNKNS